MVERFNSTLVQQLALFTANNQEDWDEHLPYLLMAYRASQHGATACSPALLMYGRELRGPVDLLCGPTPERPDRPLGEGYARRLEEGMEKVHAFARHQLQQVGMKMKRRYDHRSQVSEYPPGVKIWFFNPRRRKGRCPKLTSPWQSLGVVLAQISDMVLKIKMGPRALHRIVHADRLRPYKGDLTPSWLRLAGVAGAGTAAPVEAQGSQSLAASTRA